MTSALIPFSLLQMPLREWERETQRFGERAFSDVRGNTYVIVVRDESSCVFKTLSDERGGSNTALRAPQTDTACPQKNALVVGRARKPWWSLALMSPCIFKKKSKPELSAQFSLFILLCFLTGSRSDQSEKRDPPSCLLRRLCENGALAALGVMCWNGGASGSDAHHTPLSPSPSLPPPHSSAAECHHPETIRLQLQKKHLWSVNKMWRLNREWAMVLYLSSLEQFLLLVTTLTAFGIEVGCAAVARHGVLIGEFQSSVPLSLPLPNYLTLFKH